MITAEGRKQEGTKEMSLFNPLSLSLTVLNNGWNRMEKKEHIQEISAGIKREHFEKNVVSVFKNNDSGRLWGGFKKPVLKNYIGFHGGPHKLKHLNH